MRTITSVITVGAAFCLGLTFGIAVVQFQIGPLWRVVAGTEMHLLHTDFTTNWPMLQKLALYQDNPSPKPIVMAGDSLTDYGDWPDLLQRLDVGNRGITGDTSQGLLQRVGMLARSGTTVVVMIGENDLAAHYPVAEVCRTIGQIVDRLRMEHRVVLEATLFTAVANLNSKIAELDSCERQICERGNACTFLDLNPRLASHGFLDPKLTFDGFHLNDAGYRQWASALAPLLDMTPP